MGAGSKTAIDQYLRWNGGL